MKEKKTITVPLLRPQAQILETFYQPATHGSTTGVQIGGKSGVKPVFGSVDINAHFAVVIKCQHGKFIIEGESDSKAERMFKNFSAGDKVILKYSTKTKVFSGRREDAGLHLIAAQLDTNP